MLVIEEFQGKGGGTMIMNSLMEYLHREAPPQAYINLMADVDGFYEKWGFVPSLPNSRGMVLRG
jgi:GNAT superfamily N-acetyltransferase